MASDFLPPDDPPVNADATLAALDDLDLLDADELIATEVAPDPVGRSWVFDFQAKVFQLGNGRGPLETRGQDTLNAWIEKTLRTAKGAHPIYPSDYGMSGPQDFYGRTLTSADYAVLEARIREALTFHPRITDIDEFTAAQDPSDDVLFVSFTVILDDGEQAVVSDLALEA
jgi:hypothetical protein